MKTYVHILQTLKDNSISVVRWFTIDQYFYFQPASRPSNKDVQNMHSLFKGTNDEVPDFFAANNVWSIDMRSLKDTEQPKIEAVGKTLVQRSSFKEPKVNRIEFELD